MAHSASRHRCADIPVVLLEHDEAFRSGVSDLLCDDGHPVWAFGSIAEMPELSTLPPGAVLVTDDQLGPGDGLKLAQRFRAVRPHSSVIVVTAYASAHLMRAAAALPYVSLVHKPLPYDALHELVHHSKRV